MGRCFALRRVEKGDRADFLRGLKSGQFERYAADSGISGLYVVTPRGVAKTSELPSHVGHLMVNTSKRSPLWVAVCRRNPIFADTNTPSAVLWNVLMRMAYEHRVERYETRRNHKEKLKRIGLLVGDRVFSVLGNMDREWSGTGEGDETH